MGVDVVGEAVDVLRVAVVPLQRDLRPHPLALPLDHDHRPQHLLVAVEVFDEGGDAALVLEAVLLLVVPLVVEGDEDAAVEEAQLAQALGERVEAEGGGLEDLRVGLEGDLGAAAVGDPRVLQRPRGHPPVVGLAVHLVVAPDLDHQRLAEGVDFHHDLAHGIVIAGVASAHGKILLAKGGQEIGKGLQRKGHAVFYGKRETQPKNDDKESQRPGGARGRISGPQKNQGNQRPRKASAQR